MTWLRHLRAAAVLAVVVIVVVGALPMPGPGSPRRMADPEAQAEVRGWSDLIGSVGVDVSPAQLSEMVLAIGAGSRSAQGAVLWPVRPVIRQLAIQQGWGLFAYPDNRPHQLVIEGRPEGGAWRVVYRSLDPEAAWSEELLAYRRIRAMIDPGRKAPITYDGVVNWLARALFEDFPEFQEVRFRYRRLRTRLPGEAEKAERPAYRFERVVQRPAVSAGPDGVGP